MHYSAAGIKTGLCIGNCAILTGMKSVLYFFGSRLLHDDSLQRYVLRHLSRQGFDIWQQLHLEPSDDALMAQIASGPHEAAVIACTPDHAAFVGRVLCSLCGDTLTLEDGRLSPARATRYEGDAYTVYHQARPIHVMTVAGGCRLPEMPAPTEKAASFMLFDVHAEEAAKALEPAADSFNVTLSLFARCEGWLDARVTPRPYADVNGFTAYVSERFGTGFIRGSNIIAHLIKVLESAGKKVTFAESCTGGLLSYYLIRESGASTVFEGGVVTYSNRLKSSWIAVEESTLERHGAVSLETVSEMSEGILEVSGADFAIAVSGVAGPDGGSPDKPVGTVCIAVRSKTRAAVEQFQFDGDRNYIQEQSVYNAIFMLMMIEKELFLKNS